MRSLRDFTVVRPNEWHEELARGKPVAASSTVTQDAGRANLRFPATSPAAVVDGNVWSCWLSEPSDSQWIAVDLGRPEKLSRVEA